MNGGGGVASCGPACRRVESPSVGCTLRTHIFRLTASRRRLRGLGVTHAWHSNAVAFGLPLNDLRVAAEGRVKSWPAHRQKPGISEKAGLLRLRLRAMSSKLPLVRPFPPQRTHLGEEKNMSNHSRFHRRDFLRASGAGLAALSGACESTFSVAWSGLPVTFGVSAPAGILPAESPLVA